MKGKLGLYASYTVVIGAYFGVWLFAPLYALGFTITMVFIGAVVRIIVHYARTGELS